MSQKTEKPTQYKLKKARERGEVAKSVEFSTAFLLLGALLILWGSSSFFDRQFKLVFVGIYSNLYAPNLFAAFSRAFSPIFLPLLCFFLGICAIAIGSHFLQTGWIWGRKKSKRKGKSRRLIYPVLKILGMTLIGYYVIKHLNPSSHLIFASSQEKEIILFYKIFYLLLMEVVFLLLLGIGDWFYQKWRFYQQMHMTHQELQEEKRETEGSYEIKQKMRVDK